MRSPLSKQEVRGLSITYAGFGAFFGTLLTGISLWVPFCGGFLLALYGVWVFGEGRANRFQEAKKSP